MSKEKLLKLFRNSIFALLTAGLLAFFIFANTTGTRTEAAVSGTDTLTTVESTKSDNGDGKECTCTKKCTADEVDTTCEVCAEDYSFCEYDDGTVSDVVAEISYTYQGEETKRTYTTLAEALADIDDIAALVANDTGTVSGGMTSVSGTGDADESDDSTDTDSNSTTFTPTVKLLQDISLTETVTGLSDETYAIDFNTYTITMTNGAFLNLANATVNLKDGKASAIDFDSSNNNPRPGGMIGTSAYLVYGTGNITFTSGYYRAASGVIVNGAHNVKFDGAYVFSVDNYLVSDVKSLQFTENGFYIYNALVEDTSETTVTLPATMTFSEKTILINDNSVTGYAIGKAVFKVTVELLGADNENNSVYYYSSLSDAMDDAISYSTTNDGVETVIELVDTSTAQVVNIRKAYLITTGSNGYTPNIVIKGMNFQRGTTDDVIYDGTFFDVKAGNLTLYNCTIDGQLSENNYADTSMIIVENGAKLTLTGTDDTGTHIQKNVSLKGISESDPGAGIFMQTGSEIHMSGYITVRNNNVYTQATTETEASTDPCNLYLQGSALLVLDGPVNGSESYRIGINHGTKLIDNGKVVGKLADSYAETVDASGSDTIDLSAFYMDGAASYALKYEPTQHLLYWEKGSLLLPEAGVFRVEYIILILGMLFFILRNVPSIREKKTLETTFTVFAVVGLVLGAGIGFYHVYTERQLVDQNDEIALAITDTAVAEENKLKDEADSKLDNSTSVIKDEEIESENTDDSALAGLVPDDGREYVGLIEIEALGIRLPLLEEYSDAEMKTSPCIYYGCIENNDLVIVGHNYDSQFGTFNNVTADDDIEVKITYRDGNVYKYKMTAVEYLTPSQIDEMLVGDWDLTLFTCNYAGDKRIALRCSREAVTGEQIE